MNEVGWAVLIKGYNEWHVHTVYISEEGAQRRQVELSAKYPRNTYQVAQLSAQVEELR